MAKIARDALELEIAVLAAQLRAARAILNWSQTELAERAGLTQRSIYRLEQPAMDIRRSTMLAAAKAVAETGIQFEQLPDSGLRMTIPGKLLRATKTSIDKTGGNKPKRPRRSA